jgi:hypothetical protein
VTLVPESPTVTFSRTPSDYIRLHYTSNVSNCRKDSHGYNLRQVSIAPLPDPFTLIDIADGEWLLAPAGSGTLTATVTCYSDTASAAGSVSASTSVVILPSAPTTVTVTGTATRVAPGSQFTITWSSTNANNCFTVGQGPAAPGQSWSGTLIGTSGSQVITIGPFVSGDLIYEVGCPNIDLSQPIAYARVVVTVGSPGIQFSGPGTVTLGDSFQYSWDVPAASSCSASGGGANGSPWSGALATTGTLTQTASVVGKFTYALSCIINGESRQSSLALMVSKSGSSGSGSDGSAPTGSGSSGGGALGAWELLLAGLMLLHLQVRARTTMARPRPYLN